MELELFFIDFIKVRLEISKLFIMESVLNVKRIINLNEKKLQKMKTQKKNR